MISAVLAAGLIVGVVLVGTRHDDTSADGTKGKATASASQAPSSAAPRSAPPSAVPSGSEGPGEGAPLGGGPGDQPSDSPSAPANMVPYVALKPVQCFDHPALDSSVSKIEVRSCNSPHDGEVISNETLTGTFSSEKDIQNKALSLCAADAKRRMNSIPIGQTYYYYALYPALATYHIRGEDQVSCALTVSSTQDGKKMTKPLPG